MLPEGRVHDVIGVVTPFGLVVVMQVRPEDEEHPRVSCREASIDGQWMVACRVRHADVPAVWMDRRLQGSPQENITTQR